MTKKFTLSHLRLYILLALSCLASQRTDAQCTPTFGGCTPSYMTQTLKLGNLNLAPASCNAYNYLTDTAKICIGALDTMQITMGDTSIGIGIFIDTNRDGIFNSNEFLYGGLDTGVGSGSYNVALGNMLPTTHAGTYNVLVMAAGGYQFINTDTCFFNTGLFGSYIEFRIQVIDTLHIITQPVSLNACLYGPASFTVSATGTALMYQWFKDSTLISGATNATYTVPVFHPSDTDYYWVRVVNPCSMATSDTVNLTIHQAPRAIAVPLGDTIFCPGQTVVLKGDTVSPGNTYKWLYNNTLTTKTTSRDTVTLPGTYKFIISNGCPDTAAAITINNFATNPPTISPVGLSKVCAVTPFTYATAYAPRVHFQWQMNTGIPNIWTNIANDTSATAVVNTTASYLVVMTDSNGCVTQSSISRLQENSPATVNISTLASPYLCAGGYLTLFASSSDTGEKFTWVYNGNNIFPTATGPTYNAYLPGNYSVLGNNGCQVYSATFTVTGIPFPNVIAGGPTTFCGSGSVLLSSSVTNQMFSYQWQKNGVNIPGATGTTYTASDSGYYSVVLTSDSTCTAGSTPVHVIFHPLPAPVITISANNLTLTVSPSFNKYQWYRNGNPIPNATHASYIADTAGYYTVFVTDVDSCTGMSAQVYAPGVGSSVAAVAANSIYVYPNPATSVVIIKSPVTVNVTVTSLDGRTVLTKNAAKDINIQQLPDGVYIMHITDEDGNTIKIEKLVKANQ